MSPACEAILEDADHTFFCGQPATWLAKWSDRELFVCGKHRDDAYAAHNGDHEYDQEGIEWRDWQTGATNYETREECLKKASQAEGEK